MPISINNNARLIIQALYKDYAMCYSPLLLPKIAKLDFKLTAGSVFSSFITKIKLYDSGVIERENNVITLVKVKITHLKNFSTKNESNLREKFFDSVQEKYSESTKIRKKKLPETSRNLVNRNSYELEKSSPNKFKSQDSMTTYQELYEFIKILTYRSQDLKDLIDIIETSSQNIENLVKFSSIIEKHIENAKKIIDEIFPQESRRSMLIEENKKTSPFIKIKMQRMTLLNEKRGQENEKNPSDELNNANQVRLNTQEETEKSKKFKFLKRKENNNLLSAEFIKQKANLSKRKNNNSSQEKRFKTVPSNRPEKSFKMYDKEKNDEKRSKKTEEKFDEDIEKEIEEIEEKEKAELRKKTRSEKHIVNSYVAVEKKIFERKFRSLNYKLEHFQFSELILKRRKSDTNVVINRSKERDENETNIQKELEEANKNKHQELNQSNILKKEPRNSNLISQTARQRNSQLGDSRSSINTENEHNFKKSQFNIPIKHKRNTHETGDFEESEEFIESKKFMKETVKTKKLRVGGIRREESKVHELSSKTFSAIEEDEPIEIIEKPSKSRRAGKQLPQQMNKNFQRMLNDENITKIIEANKEKNKNRHLFEHSLKKHTANNYNHTSRNHPIGKIKRLELGSETSIGFNIDTGRELFDEKNKNRKTETEKENFTANYADLLNLQKNLKPIAAYNESKMVTRYSMLAGESESSSYQFKLKNGKFLFNHEFYLRKQHEDRSEIAEESIAREKELKKETMKFEFMEKFKKTLQKINEPVQCGYDDRDKSSEKFIQDGNGKFSLGIFI